MRGKWMKKTPEFELQVAFERIRLAKEGTINAQVLALRKRRQQMAMQPRKRLN